MFNKNPFEQVNHIGELTSTIVKRTSDCSLETINDLLSVSSKHLKGLGSARGVEDMFDMANDMGSTYLSCSQRAFNVALENFADFTKWLEANSINVNPLKQAARPFEQAAKTFTEKSDKSSK